MAKYEIPFLRDDMSHGRGGKSPPEVAQAQFFFAPQSFQESAPDITVGTSMLSAKPSEPRSVVAKNHSVGLSGLRNLDKNNHWLS